MLMHMKVLNEGSTYRGKMKTLCGRMVQHHYRQTLSPSEFTGGNQLELYGIVKRKLEVLLGPKSKFCKGYCGRARRRVERGTSRGSEGFSLLCNDRLNRSAYLAGDPKRKG